MGADSDVSTWRDLVFHGGLIALPTLFITLILTMSLPLEGVTPYLLFAILLTVLVISSHVWRELIVSDTSIGGWNQIQNLIVMNRREITKRLIAAWIAAAALTMIAALIIQGSYNLIQTNGTLVCTESNADPENATPYSELSDGEQNAVEQTIEEGGADPPTGFTNHETIIYQNTTYSCSIDRA